jgi:hypothetical protein
MEVNIRRVIRHKTIKDIYRVNTKWNCKIKLRIIIQLC